MSELTDEQLREFADSKFIFADMHSMATELLALRAERAKLEGALRKCRPLIGCFPSKSAADLVDEVEALIGKYDWFAHPAESGATEVDRGPLYDSRNPNNWITAIRGAKP